jgi:diguanylate cyclase (GGDEF)-like protein
MRREGSAPNDLGGNAFVGKVFRHIYQGVFGLQFRTTLLLTCVVLAATGLTGLVYLRITERFAVAETKRHARDMAMALAGAVLPAVENRDRRALVCVAEGLAQNDGVAYVIFTDVGGVLLASHQRGAGNIVPFLRDDARSFSVEPINQPRVITPEGQGSRIDIVYPVATQADSADGSGLSATVGYVRLGISLTAAEARLGEVARNVFGLAAGITFLMVPLSYEVVRRLVKPIHRLASAARAFAAGELDTRVPADRRDELGELNEAFNGMADELAGSHNQLVKLNAELEDRVLQRTTSLEEANGQLRDMAVRDSLTGLYNRRHFSELIERLFAEATRYQTDLTCLMLDLDNFKRVNDSLGHQTGDRLLQMTAEVIRESVRESDIPVRFGGDEFVVLLPRTSSADARSLAERMLRNFRDVLAKEVPEANIASLSIGLASREEDQPMQAMDLVHLADEALYLAKAGGKNRITVLRPGAVHVRATA